MTELETSEGRSRALTGFAASAAQLFLAAITIVGCLWALGVQYRLGMVLFKEQFLAVMFGLGLAGAFLVAKPTLTARNDKVAWYDWILVALSLLAGGYVAIGYPALLRQDINAISKLVKVIGLQPE